jgi:hypothetical protein
MKRVAGLAVIVGVLLQAAAFAAIPVAARDAALGSGPLAWAWLIGLTLSITVGLMLAVAS